MKFKADADIKEVDSGSWGEFQGCQFLITHTSSTRFQRALSRNQQPHRKKIEQGTLDPEVNRDIICKAMSEGMLLDWKGVTNSAGETVPYTPEAGLRALKGQVDFRDFVSEFSMSINNFRKQEIEEVGKP